MALACSSPSFDCIKAYDVRGTVPDQLNAEIATRIAWALVTMLEPKSCVIGWDVRLHSPMIVDALTTALSENGVEVIQLGLAGTEEVYYWVGNHNLDMGLMVTASHNPAEYNGIKIVRHGAAPMVGDTGMDIVKQLAMETTVAPRPVTPPAPVRHEHDKSGYIAKLLEIVQPDNLKPLKLVINSGNGVAGPVIDKLEEKLPLDIIHMNALPDGTFPNGIPNPLVPEKRQDTIAAVQAHGADMGVAFDGDFDRCFFFDSTGSYIEGYYVVAMLAKALLTQHPGESICYDPRLIWNTEDVVTAMGGKLSKARSGHTFMKAQMREDGCIYGGEMSAHHYFRDFYYCDSGMLPWLLVAQLMSTTGKSLTELIGTMTTNYPCTGEINFALPDSKAQQNKIAEIEALYTADASSVEYIDGLSVTYDNEGWRFNLRSSNTEPLLRLNIETRNDQPLAWSKLEEIKKVIENDKI